VVLGITSQEVMPGETSGEVMRRRSSAEARLLRRRPLMFTVNGSPFSEKNGVKFQMHVARRKKISFSFAIK